LDAFEELRVEFLVYGVSVSDELVLDVFDVFVGAVVVFDVELPAVTLIAGYVEDEFPVVLFKFY